MSWDLQRLGMLAAVVAAAPFTYNQPVAAQGCVPAPPDLVSWWPGDGNANDIVGTNHGTLNGATFAAGNVGQAFSFDGSNDFVDAAQQQVFSGSYTVDAWVNTNTLNPGGFFNEAFILDRTEGGATALINLFQKGSDLVFRIRGDNILGLSLVKALGVLITNTWIHVTGVRDITTGQIRIYVNGVLKGTAADGTSGPSTFTFRIGAHSDVQLHWNGLIDEVEVFDRALSASEIQAIFLAGSAGKCKAIDTDGDGLTDDVETNTGVFVDATNTGTDPNNPDTDGDGLSDGDEVNTYATSPLVADTDGDGLTDGEEIASQAFGCPDPLVADTDADGLDDGTEVGLGLDPCDDADFDADGLMDAQEILVFGTDPVDPDSDNDGMLDGTEVDVAQGTGCPDPLDPDSDDDTISDGDEIAAGTNPCDNDTDGDGLADNVDPTPTVPGATTGFLEDFARALADEIQALDLGLFNGPNNNANNGRGNALANRATDAANAIAAGDIGGAIESLESLLAKIDGESPPPDWMDESPQKTALAVEVELLIALLLLE